MSTYMSRAVRVRRSLRMFCPTNGMHGIHIGGRKRDDRHIVSADVFDFLIA